jgi:hypothetical protein
MIFPSNQTHIVLNPTVKLERATVVEPPAGTLTDTPQHILNPFGKAMLPALSLSPVIGLGVG